MTRGIILACSLFMLTCLPAAAFTANGLVGERTGVRWSNAANIGGDQALITTWSAVHGAITTTMWTPGIGSSPSSVILTHASANTPPIKVDIGIIGLEYQTDNVKLYNPASSLRNICDIHKRSGDIVRVIGSECFHPGKFQLKSHQTPFRFVRPIISWPDNLAESFSGKPEGVYQGVLPVQIRYAYLSESFSGITAGVNTYQNISRSLMIRLTYKKNQVTSVILYGQSLMPMKIDRAKREVSGKTIHRVIAKGFGEGLNMRFQDENHDFSLRHVDSSLSTYSIPYSIKLICGEGTECADDGALLVQDGDLKKKFSKKSGGVRVVPANGSKWPELKFSLLSSYQEIKLDDPSNGGALPEGEYQDHVVLIFEPAL